MVVFCHYLAMKGRLLFWKKFSTHIYCRRWSGKSFIANLMLVSAKTKLPSLLWLAEWKAPAPFQTVKPTKNLGRVRTTRMNTVIAREQSKEADHSSAPCKPALGHCQIEARHKRMKKEGRKYSNLLALKVLLDSLWPMITIPIPSIPSLPTHKASLII